MVCDSRRIYKRLQKLLSVGVNFRRPAPLVNFFPKPKMWCGTKQTQNHRSNLAKNLARSAIHRSYCSYFLIIPRLRTSQYEPARKSPPLGSGLNHPAMGWFHLFIAYFQFLAYLTSCNAWQAMEMDAYPTKGSTNTLITFGVPELFDSSRPFCRYCCWAIV